MPQSLSEEQFTEPEDPELVGERPEPIEELLTAGSFVAVGNRVGAATLVVREVAVGHRVSVG